MKHEKKVGTKTDKHARHPPGKNYSPRRNLFRQGQKSKTWEMKSDPFNPLKHPKTPLFLLVFHDWITSKRFELEFKFGIMAYFDDLLCIICSLRELRQKTMDKPIQDLHCFGKLCRNMQKYAEIEDKWHQNTEQWTNRYGISIVLSKSPVKFLTISPSQSRDAFSTDHSICPFSTNRQKSCISSSIVL